jgi:hypothetical protein
MVGEEVQARQDVQGGQVGLGCVLFLKIRGGARADCVKRGDKETWRTRIRHRPNCKLRAKGFNHPATILNIDNGTPEAPAAEPILTFVQVSSPFFFLQKRVCPDLKRKMTSNPPPRCWNHRLPVRGYSFSSGGMDKPTYFLLNHVYTLPASHFLNFGRGGGRSGYDVRFDEESIRRLLQILQLRLNWQPLENPVYKRQQVLQGEPAQQTLPDNPSPTEHAQHGTLDSTNSEDAINTAPLVNTARHAGQADNVVNRVTFTGKYQIYTLLQFCLANM